MKRRVGARASLTMLRRMSGKARCTAAAAPAIAWLLALLVGQVFLPSRILGAATLLVQVDEPFGDADTLLRAVQRAGAQQGVGVAHQIDRELGEAAQQGRIILALLRDLLMAGLHRRGGEYQRRGGRDGEVAPFAGLGQSPHFIAAEKHAGDRRARYGGGERLDRRDVGLRDLLGVPHHRHDVTLAGDPDDAAEAMHEPATGRTHVDRPQLRGQPAQEGVVEVRRVGGEQGTRAPGDDRGGEAGCQYRGDAPISAKDSCGRESPRTSGECVSGRTSAPARSRTSRVGPSRRRR